MSVKPNLNSVWQASWGTMPALDDLWEAPADPSVAPGLWPSMPENSGFRVIPILNKGLWLTLVKVDEEGALTDAQKQGLLALGFREGSNGRIIHPGYPTQGIVNAVNQVVGGKLEPLSPEQVVTLTSADQYEPKVPLAVQAGIRWFWKTRPADLLSEIVVSLSEQEDDLPVNYQSLLAGTTLSDRGDRLATGPISNPARLQMWVSQALSGEITPVTEPILSLGLNKGMEVYGATPSDWPEDCQALREQLREFRGDEPAQEGETVQPLFANTTDLRPPLRTRVTWEIDNGRKSGIVVALPEDDEEGLWVMPLDTQSPNHSALPFYAPIRIRIPLYTVVDPVIQKPEPADLNNLFSQFAPETEQVTEGPALDTLFDEPAPALVEAETEAETEAPDAGAETPKAEEPEVEPEAVVETPETLQGELKPQPAFTLADLPPAYQSPADNVQVASALRGMLDSQVRALTQYGKHPLTAPMSDHIDDMVAGWREDVDNFLWQTPDRKEAGHNASLIARDLMLRQFNDAQPAMPGGVRSPLAVLPMGTQISGADPKNLLKDQIDELDLDWYRVGINPALLPAIQDRLQQWENNEYKALHEQLGRDAAVEVIRSIDRFRNSSATLNELTFGPVAETYRRQFSTLFHKVDSEIREANPEVDYNTPAGRNDLVIQVLKEMASPERRREIQARSNGHLFPSQEAAAQVVLGNSPDTQAVTEGNRRLLKSIANLAGTSLADVEQANHPLFVVCDVMQEAGLTFNDRAEALARLGIDLNHRAHWVGQIAALSGVTINLAHNTYIEETPAPDEADDLIERNIIKSYERERGRQRATITTGFLRRGESLHPFQVGVLSTKENLFDEYTASRQTTLFIGEDGDINTQPDGRYESLGRLVDLNAIAPIAVGEPLTTDNQVLTVEARDKLEPNWYGVDAQDLLEGLSVTQTSLLTAMHPCSALPELPDQIGKTPAQELALKARDNKDILMTATPAWRHNQDRRSQVLEALKLFQQDFKPIASAADPDSVVSAMLKSLTNTPRAEIMVIGAKASRRNFWYRTEVITRSDLEKHGMDRELAVEYAILDMKYRDSSMRKGHHFASFDVTQTLRPEAIRYLNDLQEKARLQRILDKEESRGDDQGAEKTASKRRGKRQDKGLVAGLAAKDLRGKTQQVLATLDNASRADQAKFISKTKLWEAPDWVFLRAPSDDDILKGAEPMEPIVAAFFDEMRTRIASQPPANIPAISRQYAKFVLGVRDAFDRIRTEEQLLDALTPESGELAELEQEVSDTLRKLDTQPHLVLGDEVASGRFTYGYYYNDDDIEFEPAFRHILEKARRRSQKNTHWDIKDTTGKGRRPITSDKPDTGAMPMLSKLVRKGGKDHRGGLDISEEAVIKTFGFSGIEYGNSMTQIDRTTYLNEAYDGFMDIAELLDVPPQALSLGGTLGLAFGSRGRGGRRAALAHFEPGNNAINLTRMKGAGSMAHEYGHAFANYLYRLSRGTQGSRSAGDITTSIDKQVTRGGDKEIMGGNLRAPVAEAVAEVLRAMRYRPIKDSDYKTETLLMEGARKADRLDGRKTPYWATIEEMFARSFETYVHVGLSAKYPGFRNDFLVRPDKLTVWGNIPHSAKTALENFEEKEKAGLASKEKLPENATEAETEAYMARRNARQQLIGRIRRAPILYPAGDELKRVKGAFDTLFETLETKDQSVRHDHLGMIDLPILYSHDTGSIARISEKEHQILAHCVMQEVARMCGPEVWVSWHKELEDDEGKPVAGRFREHPTAQEKVRAVIDLAFGAPLGTAHHEAFHFAQRHLLTQDENQMMDRHFAPDSELTQRLVESLKAEGKHDLIEVVTRDPKEAQAYAYEQWVRGKLDVKVTEQPVTVFGKVNSFFGRVLGISTNSGFSTPEQVFQAFYQGDLAARRQAERVREALNETPEVTAPPAKRDAPERPETRVGDAIDDDLEDDLESDLFFRQGC